MPKAACRWFYFWGAIAGAPEILTEKVSLNALLDKSRTGKKRLGIFCEEQFIPYPWNGSE